MRLIDADALLKRFTVNMNGQRIPEKDCDNFPVQVVLAEVKRMIRKEPTIEPVKRGEWNGWTTSAFIGIDEENEPRFADRKFYRCGDCRYGSVIKTNFCPNCGADMRTEESDDK